IGRSTLLRRLQACGYHRPDEPLGVFPRPTALDPLVESRPVGISASDVTKAAPEPERVSAVAPALAASAPETPVTF
ncbi:MAG: hypothetical protein ABIR79_04245, partial [Candidatus Binatia bacterium]